MIAIRDEKEIGYIKDASRIVAEVLQVLGEYCKEGITAEALDCIAEEKIKARNAEPAFKGYHGYPKSICVSVNNVVVHGIPNKRQLHTGDIVSIDVGVRYKGYCSDAARTYAIGALSEDAQRLMNIAEQSLYKGIAQAKQGNRVGDISWAIQQYVEKNGMNVVRDFVGHGIGTAIHEDPQIPNYGQKAKGPLLKAGMVLAIEPMVNLGASAVRVLADQWTVVTKDNSLSAHFEHTIVVSKKGPEILTIL